MISFDLFFFVHIKMSYYLFNRRSYCKKQKTDIITVVVKKKLNIILRTGGLKENKNNKYKILSEEEKKAKREYQRNRYRSVK